MTPRGGGGHAAAIPVESAGDAGFGLPVPVPAPAPDPVPAPEPVPFRRLHVPFGPFLALAAIEWLLFSKELAGAFVATFGGGR